MPPGGFFRAGACDRMATMKQTRAFTISAGIAVIFLSSVPVAVAGFERNLYFGLRNDAEVVRMQEFLRGQGYFSYPVSTGNYLTVTMDAVKRFQSSQGLPPFGGYFGPQSRAAANKILQGNGGVAAPQAPTSAVPSPPPTASPYEKKIVIIALSGTSVKPASEQLIIENKSKGESISITGFRIENSSGGSLAIPKGHELPGFSATANDPITLRPGDRAVITMGKQERQINFRENLCTGYFDEFSGFSPALAHRCLRPDLGRAFELSDRCINFSESVSSCRVPNSAKLSALFDNRCGEFAQAHFNYNGCVRDYRSRSDFYSRRWLIWMQRDQEFFRNAVERVILKDAQGKIVDESSY